MIGDARRAAVLDTNVLFPPSLRDTLIYAAEGGLYQVVWSAEILDELRRNLVEVAGLSQELADRRIGYMASNFPEASVPIAGIITPHLPDPGDRHLVAAALAANARFIVTENLKHFPATVLDPLNVSAMNADAFLTMLFASDPVTLTDALEDLTAHLRRPPMDTPTFLDVLAPHAPTFSAQMRAYLRHEAALFGPVENPS